MFSADMENEHAFSVSSDKTLTYPYSYLLNIGTVIALAVVSIYILIKPTSKTKKSRAMRGQVNR